MPVVPDIDVHRLGRLRNEHDEVDKEADGQHDRRNRRSPRKTCRARPADVNDREIDAETRNHGLCRGTEIIDEQCDDETDSDKADADGKSGTK